MSSSSQLNTISTYFFAAGFVLSKATFIPPVFIGALFSLLSLGSYFIAYLLWIVRTYLEPDTKAKEEHWYGFLQVQEQLRLAGILNLCATLLSVAAVFLPVLILPASCLFVAGHVIWAMGEYHKLNNPPNDPSYSPVGQKAFVTYTQLICVMTLITGVSASLCVFFPALLIPILVFTLLFSVGCGGIAAQYLLQSHLADKQHIYDSYAQMTDSLEPLSEKPLEKTTELSNEANYTSLFADAADKAANEEYTRPQESTYLTPTPF